MRSLLSAVAVVALVASASGCTHRPRYKELVKASGVADAAEGDTVPVVLVDPKSNEPLADVKVKFGDGAKRVSLTSDAQGRIRVPVRKDLDKDDPLVEVSRAQGGGYALSSMAAAPKPVPEPVPAAPGPTDATGVTPEK